MCKSQVLLSRISLEKLVYCLTRSDVNGKLFTKLSLTGQENGKMIFDNQSQQSLVKISIIFDGENLLIVVNMSYSSKQNALLSNRLYIAVPLQVCDATIYCQNGTLSARNKLTADFHSRFVKKKKKQA